jgi:hypothetical protein
LRCCPARFGTRNSKPTRVTTLGELIASIAHEINQPLAAVANNAGACLRWLAAQNLEEARLSASLVIADGRKLWIGLLIGRFAQKFPRKPVYLIAACALRVRSMASAPEYSG